MKYFESEIHSEDLGIFKLVLKYFSIATHIVFFYLLVKVVITTISVYVKGTHIHMKYTYTHSYPVNELYLMSNV